jgi:hypothetical protein
MYAFAGTGIDARSVTGSIEREYYCRAAMLLQSPGARVEAGYWPNFRIRGINAHVSGQWAQYGHSCHLSQLEQQMCSGSTAAVRQLHHHLAHYRSGSRFT